MTLNNSNYPTIRASDIIFREEFSSPFDVAKNGGVVTGAPTIDNGYTGIGTNDLIQYDGTSVNGATGVGQPITVRYWIKTTQSGTPIISEKGTNLSIINQLTAGGFARWRVNTGSTTSTTAVNDGEWHQVVGTFDGTQNKIYVDGDGPQQTVADTSVVENNNPFVIGGRSGGTGGLDGELRDFIVSDRVWTDQEVLDDFNNATYVYPNQAILNYQCQDKIGSSSPFITTELAQGANATYGDGAGSREPTRILGRNGNTYAASGFLQSTPTGLPEGGSARTVVVWSKRTTVAGGALLAFNAASGQKYILSDQQVTGTNFVFTDGVNAPNNITVSNAQRAQIGNIVLHGFTLDGSDNWEYYLNGEMISSGTFSTPINTATITSVTIGERLDFSAPFSGDIYTAGEWDYGLTSTQMKDLYNKGSKYLGNL